MHYLCRSVYFLNYLIEKYIIYAILCTVFYRKVKSILGVTPIDLVKDMRVKRAIQLLDSGNYNISQVAYMSGFSSPQYFSRVFKELKNCTPSEYKTKAFD